MKLFRIIAWLCLISLGGCSRSDQSAGVEADKVIYIRGDFNHWGLESPLSRVGSDLLAGIDLEPGTYSFKIGSDTWKQIDLGGENENLIPFKHPLQLIDKGKNLKVQIGRKGSFVFKVSLDDPKNRTLEVLPGMLVNNEES